MKNYFRDIGLWPASSRIARAYVIGFVLSLILTLLAYAVATSQSLSGTDIALIVALFALAQFAVQVFCFLHLGKGSGDRLLMLCWAMVIIGILVIGSLWIMYSLNGRMLPSEAQMEQYMNDQVGF